MDTGALPYQTLVDYCSCGFVENGLPENVSPASIDLALSDEVYQVDRVIRTKPGVAVRDVLPAMGAEIPKSQVLEKGKLYMIRLEEVLHLPKAVQGYCNPKSSTGRLDVHVRVMCDGVFEFDTVPLGYEGEMWLFFVAKSFAVKAHPGNTLAQLRLIRGKTRLSQTNIETLYAKQTLGYSARGQKLSLAQLQGTEEDSGGLLLSMFFPKKGEVFGYRCIASENNVLDLSAVRSVDPGEFFLPERVRNDQYIELVPNRFYILSSAESIVIPPSHASEMVAVHERLGEHRSHYAGFLDPGWGWGKVGKGRGRPFTLEVRSPEKFTVVPGQPVARIVYEKMSDEPHRHYDDGEKVSNYTTQRTFALGKQFVLQDE